MTDQNKIYELGYLLLPDLTESEAASSKEELKKMITTSGGESTTDGAIIFIDLAYEMVKKIKSKNHKYDQAYFSWIKFSAPSDVVRTITDAASTTESVLRSFVVTTEADDALTDLFVPDETEEEVKVDVNEGVDMGEDKAKSSEVKEEKPAKASTSKGSDNLTKIEGIGPKISETLTAAGVDTFAKLADTTSEKIQEIITDVRGSHDSTTWPKQAKLASEDKWDELKTWQDEMDGGKE